MLKALFGPVQAAGVRGQALDGAAASATLSLVTSLQALRELEADWRALESHAQDNVTVFQSFDWTMAWAETYVGEGKGLSLHILAGYDSGELVFLWPLMRCRQYGFAILTWLTEPFGQYGDVLCRNGQSPRQWINGSLSFLRRLKDVDLLRLRHVRADSHLARHASDQLVNARMPEKAPFLDLTAFTTEEDYDTRYTPVQRKRRKKIRKALEEMGPVSFTRLPVGILADAAMTDAIAQKNEWLNDRGRINRVLGCPLHIPFLKTLSRRRGGSVEVIVSEMRAGEKPVSWEIGFRHGHTHFGYITSHVNALTDFSPGRLHMDQSQRDALKAGMNRFDLMVPNDAHKESWSSATVDTEDYFVPLSSAGWLLGHGAIKTLRPILRRIYYALDAETLRKLNLKARLRALFTPPSKP